MKEKLLWAYLAQAYISLIGIVLAPLYLRYLGAEGFGLVGVYIMLQAWMPIFDIGLTPVLSREMSRFRAGALTAQEAATRLRTLEVFLGMLATLSVVMLWVNSGWVGHNWLSAVTLPGDAIAHSIVLMGVAVALRWFAGLQRAVLIGLEYQGLVNGSDGRFCNLAFCWSVAFVVIRFHVAGTFFCFSGGGRSAGTNRLRDDRSSSCSRRRRHPAGSHVLAKMFPMVGSMAFLTAIWVSPDADRQVDPIGVVAFEGIWLLHVGCHGCQRGAGASRTSQSSDPAAPDHTALKRVKRIR